MRLWRCYLVVSVLLVAIFVPSNFHATINDEYKFIPCRTEFETSILIIGVLGDLFACITNLILFIIPLKKVSKSIQHAQVNKASDYNNIDINVNSKDSKETLPHTHAQLQMASTPSNQSNNNSINAVRVGSISPNHDQSPSPHATIDHDNNVRVNNFASIAMETTSNDNDNINININNKFENRNLSNKERETGKKTTEKRKDELLAVAKKLTVLTGIGIATTIGAIVMIGMVGMPIVWYVLAKQKKTKTKLCRLYIVHIYTFVLNC